MSNGSITLGQVASKRAMLEIPYMKCERYGRLSVARLIGGNGRDMDMPTLRGIIAADCVRRQSMSVYDWCGLYYPQLPGVFG